MMSSASTSPNKVFLFHGSDTFRSYTELRTWKSRYAARYPDAVEHSISADELSEDRFAAWLQPLVMGDSLFSLPAFVVIKRPSSRERQIEALLAQVAADTFVVLWEPGALPETSVLFSISDQVKEFAIPGDTALVHRLETLLASAEMTLDEDARRHVSQLLRLELERVRGEKRLRSGQILDVDERGWWVASLALRLRALGVSHITQAHLELVTSADPVPARVFGLVDAILSGNTGEVARTVALWRDQSVDQGMYYAVLSLLGRSSKRVAAISSLLAQVDLIIKNGLLDIEIALCALTDAIAKGKEEIFEDRLLWKVAVARFGR